jgi:hypothetical protein
VRRRLILLERRRSSLRRWEAGAAAPGHGAAEGFSSRRGVADPVYLSLDLQGRWADRLWWLLGGLWWLLGSVTRGPVWCCGSRRPCGGGWPVGRYGRLCQAVVLVINLLGALLRGGAGNATCRLCCRGGMRLCSWCSVGLPMAGVSQQLEDAGAAAQEVPGG